jgi:hypothetical protein
MEDRKKHGGKLCLESLLNYHVAPSGSFIGNRIKKIAIRMKKVNNTVLQLTFQ